MPKAKITGIGKYLPPKVVTNFDLEKLMDTTDDWITQRSGIRERRWIRPGQDTLSGMAKEASLMALKNAGITAQDLDAIVYATMHSDYVIPGGGVQLQNDLCPERTIPAIDIRNQCSGFLYALSVADAWIRAGNYKKILVVGAEVQSTSLDKSTEGRDIAVLFGDGAGAVVVEATDNPNEGFLNITLHSEGKYADRLWTPKPSVNDEPRMSPKLFESGGFRPYMDGKTVFKNAVVRMCEVMGEVLKKEKISPEQVNFVIAHQANLRINNMVMEQLGIPPERTHNTLQKYGNTTAATIPVTLCEAVEEGKIKKGDLVAFVAFGSGFTWGASLMKW